MMNPRKRRNRPTLDALERRELMAGDGPAGTWIGQDGRDLAGPATALQPSGVQDVHIALNGLTPGREVASAIVDGDGGGQWRYNGPFGPWGAALQRSPGSATADVYFEPYQVEVGRRFWVHLYYADGGHDEVVIAGGAADPSLRMPEAAAQLAWVGQDGRDLVGAGASVGPDRRVDAHLTLENLAPNVEIVAVTLTAPGGPTWRSGPNRQGDRDAAIVRRAGDPTRADLYIQVNENLSGSPLDLTIAYANGTIDAATATAGLTDPALAMPAVALPTVVAPGATARWLGQDGAVAGASLGAVHLAVEGLPAGRRVVAAGLGDGEVGGSWAWRESGSTAYVEPYALPLAVVAGADPTRLDLGFAPIRDESGRTLSLRLTLDDGSIVLVGVAGAAADLSKRAPSPAATSVVARPGDDLNDLADRFGTVRLAAGTYHLSTPLVLNRPVTITAEPGATLLFDQPAGVPAWTAAIKVHQGNTTLDGFAVRFAGPVRWDQSVGYGPAVIGTTDDRDAHRGGDKVNLTLAHLDLEGPPASSPWEFAPKLIRLATAENGRIEGNVLKGGTTEFVKGPWAIVGNDYRGTQAQTQALEVFAGHYVHDLDLRGNHAHLAGPSGKTWRFLVLTHSGGGVTVANNLVEGIGPRDGDPIESPNAREIVLTEAYRLTFEGRPAAVSADGRTIRLAEIQGEPAGVGSVVAVLSGPGAGQWRRVVQVIDDRTYLVDSPLPTGVAGEVISIAAGFVGAQFLDNTIDLRGSNTAADLVLSAAQFGTIVSGNRLIGGAGSRLTAATSEAPVHWGWSHVPAFDLTVAGNTFEDALIGATIAVEHAPTIKSNYGRVYLTGTLAGNTVAYTEAFLATRAANAPLAFVIGDPGSIDPGELVLSLTGNRLVAPEGTREAGAVVVHAATIDGRTVIDARLKLQGPPPAAPTGVGLANDTGASATDGLTFDGRLLFQPATGAARYEYRVGNSAYRDVTATGGAPFLPAGLAEGANSVAVRAVGADGQAGPEASFSFVIDATPPTSATPVLDPGSDTGASAADRVTRARSLAFGVAAAAIDTVALLRGGVEVARRTGPGALADPGPLADGVHVYTLRRVDPAGNASLSHTVGVVVDTAGPAAVARLAAGADGRVAFQAPSDAAAVEYRVGFGAYGPAGSLADFRPSGLVPGANLVTVRAIDLAGNPGAEAATVVYQIPDTGQATGAAGVWLGQDGSDFAGASSIVAAPDGFQDVHVRLVGLPAGRAITFVDVRGHGGGQWQFGGLPFLHWKVAVARQPGATTADVYWQPYAAETGRAYGLIVGFDDGRTAQIYLAGGAIDSSKRATPPRWPAGRRTATTPIFTAGTGATAAMTGAGRARSELLARWRAARRNR